jgi:hypothetical protein
VRKLAIGAVMTAWVLVCPPGVAHADEVADLVATGEVFAKQGEWTQAISAFKQADAQQPRAKHACLIGLAYTRRELWPQAEIFFARCRARITADDPAPDWLADAERTLTEKLTTSGAAAVAIAVIPESALAQVAISAFAPDETFSPRTIHLAPGTYTITVTAPGHRTETRPIVIDGTAREVPVTMTLTPTAVPVPVSVPVPVPIRPAAPPASPVPRYVLIAGGAVAAVGLGYHVFALGPAHGRLSDATTHAAYEANQDAFVRARRVTVGLYATGAVIALTGLVLRYTVFRPESPVQISGSIGSDHGNVALEWRR